MTGEKRRTNTVVNDKNGRPTNALNERLKVWKKHFDDVLNKESPISLYKHMKWKPDKMTENLTSDHSDQLK